MFEFVAPYLRQGQVRTVAMAMCVTSVLGATASAQTTVTLNQTDSQVTDTTIRSGSYSNTNHDGQPLLTRAASDPEWSRRTLIKFDTHNSIPEGADIVSATLTLTVRSGLGTAGTTRPIYAYRVPTGFLESEATWNTRMGSSRWSTPGGDVAEHVGSANVTNGAGTRVSFNVTGAVRQIVNGAFDSRYTRFLLLDAGADDKDSFREYYSSEDSSASRRPTLTVVLAGSTPPPPTTSSSTLKVLQWNISQGYGTDGRSNISRVVDFIVANRPDVISFNEIMRYSSSSQPQQIADALRARTDQTWTYNWVQKWGASSGEGECVMTRLPLEAQADYLLSYERSIAMARVNVNGRNIHVFSTHLDHQSSSRRLTQVREVVNWSNNYAEQRIVAGDFNGWPGTSEINEMLRTHHDGWGVARSAGTAVSYSSNPEGNTRNSRIDFVFHSRGASALQVTRAQVYDTRDSSGHKPSDHNPLIVTYRVN